MTCVATNYSLNKQEQAELFDIAKQMQEEYGDLYSDSDSDSDSDSNSDLDSDDGSDDDSECKHLHTIEKNGSYVCTECGNILSAVIYSQESYAEGGSARHHHRKFEERGILKELAEFTKIPRHIKLAADDEYHKQVETAIKRGRNRAAIIFACVVLAYKKANMPRNPHLIAEDLKTNKKTMSLGVKYFHNIMEPQNVKFRPVDPSKSTQINKPTQYKILDALESGQLTIETLNSLAFLNQQHTAVARDSAEAIDLIRNYLRIIKEQKNIDIDEEQPIQLYRYILNNYKGNDYIGDRHNSKSLTAGIIYYILKKTHSITKREFKGLVGISEITITKVVQEITDLMSNPKNKT